jgi:lipopolysaccharide transport system ATP-binding protein
MSDSDVIIKVENLSKKFCRSLKRSMAYGMCDISRSMVGISTDTTKLRKGEFWALDDVSFEVRKGEKLGFLGVNGSGKSTLLRLINGIFPPDKGKIIVKGKIGALISVGVGFHPYMTGRENIYLNGTILGMTKKEIQRKFDNIVDFADIGDFLDAPVSTYSSGMTVRLGFAIAIHCEPAILLVDEVLSVGDLGFALKCQKKMSEYRRNGGTFILVSHNMQMVRNTCDQAIWLEKGKIIESGNIYKICDLYESQTIQNSCKSAVIESKNIFRYDKNVQITKVEFLDQDNNINNIYQTGDQFRVKIYYNTSRIINNPIFTLGITNSEGIFIFENYSNLEKFNIGQLSGAGSIEFSTNCLHLVPNIYFVTITLSEGEILNKLEWHERVYPFSVIGGKMPTHQGLIYPYPRWKIGNTSESGV